MKQTAADRCKAIKRRLREIKLLPNQRGAAAEVARLTGEYRRLSRQADVKDAAATPRRRIVPGQDPWQQDTEAYASLPTELRGRIADHAVTRQILPSRYRD